MTEVILKLITEYGILPAIAVYLIYAVTVDIRRDIRDLRSEVEKTNHSLTDSMIKQNESIVKMAAAVSKLQGAVTTQVNTILIRFIDLTSGKDGED